MNKKLETTGPLLATISEIRDSEKKKAEALALLLEEQTSDTRQLVVMKGHMGDTDTWVGTASLAWLAKNVKMFTDLKLFQHTRDRQGNFVIDEATIAELRQRAPNWSRQPQLVYYLVRHKTRIFPPMLVVVEEPWVHHREASEWGPDGRSTRTSLPVERLNHSGTVGRLNLRNLTTYVLDGQHRLMGINGALELLDYHTLTLKRKNGSPSGKTIKLEEMLKKFRLSHSAVTGLAHETMGIQFIPAVMKGETYDEARVRVRSIFVHVNKTAKAPTAGELVLLDEDDGFAVVTKEVALKHPLLKKDRPGDRVHWTSSALPAGSIRLTTGRTLRDMTEVYLRGASPYAGWVASKGTIAVRPPEIELKDAERKFTELLSRLSELLPFQAIRLGDDVDVWREFPPKGAGHLLLRPLGQLILTEALGRLHMDANGPKVSLDKIFRKLKDFDGDGGFEEVNLPKSYWWGITYDPQRKTMSMERRNTAVLLLQYLVNGLDTERRTELAKGFQDSRYMQVSETEIHGYNFNGHQVHHKDAIKLPPML